MSISREPIFCSLRNDFSVKLCLRPGTRIYTTATLNTEVAVWSLDTSLDRSFICWIEGLTTSCRLALRSIDFVLYNTAFSSLTLFIDILILPRLTSYFYTKIYIYTEYIFEFCSTTCCNVIYDTCIKQSQCNLEALILGRFFDVIS